MRLTVVCTIPVLLLSLARTPVHAQDHQTQRPAEVKALSRGPDDQRPDDQLNVSVWGRPLTIGGELETEAQYRGNFALRDGARDDLARFDQELELELFYPLRDNVFLFLKGKAVYRGEGYKEASNREFLWAFRRDETWLYLDHLWSSNFSLQIGRQSFREEHEWWWERELDGVRLYYDRPSFHGEIAVARRAARIATDETFGTGVFDKTTRLLGQAVRSWTPHQRFDVFFLYHLDPASQETEEPPLEDQGIKRSNTRLLWLGGRFSGREPLARVGRLFYGFDGAWVGGRETLLGCATIQDADCLTPIRRTRSVSGWAFNGTLSWETQLSGHPPLTLGYAYGSGQRANTRGVTRTFRQTGLHDNDGRFRGENHFRYYGELLRPELSNLHIWTAAFGFRFWSSSSLEFVYHLYRQVHPTPFVRSARLEADPLGERRDIGQEWDLVLGLEEWEHVEIEVGASLFRAGTAYGPLSGETAYGTTIKIEYTF